MAITWLHLSDLHRGQPGDVRWGEFKNRFLDDLKIHVERLGAPDLILFTGDLAYRGSHSDYERVDETLDAIFDVVGEEVLLIPVPGNHDLVRPHKHDLAAVGCEHYFGKDARYRQGLLDELDTTVHFFETLFKEYTRWWESRVKPTWDAHNHQLGMLPGDFFLSYEKDDLRLGVAGLNSAFLHFGENGDRDLAVEYEQLACRRSPEDWRAQHDASILLMHHPRQWLHRKSEATLMDSLIPPNSFTLCMFGHMHAHSYEQVIGADNQSRRWIQGASLFGLEDYGTTHEARLCGYSWGRLERQSDETAKLTRWPRELRKTELGGWTITNGVLGSYPQEAKVKLSKRRDDSNRQVKCVIVAVRTEFGVLLTSLKERIARLPKIKSVDIIDANDAGDCELGNFHVRVVIVGASVGTGDRLREAVAEKPTLVFKAKSLNAEGVQATELAEVEKLVQTCDVLHSFDTESEVCAIVRGWLQEQTVNSGSGHSGVTSAFQHIDAAPYVSLVFVAFEEQSLRAHEAFKSGIFADAYDEYTALLEKALSIEETDGSSAAVEWVARCRLNIGACLIALQRANDALVYLNSVDLTSLADDSRLVLVKAYVNVGDLEQARAIVPSLSAQSADDANHILELVEGRVPPGLRKTPEFVIPAARILIDEGRFRTGLEWIVEALAIDSNTLLDRLGLVEVLTHLLETWLWAHTEEQTLSHGDAQQLIEVLSSCFEALSKEHLTGAHRVRVTKLEALFATRVQDPRRRAPLEKLLRQSDALESTGLATAMEMATAGDLPAAEALLANDDHPFRRRFQLVALMELAGDPTGAQSAILELARMFPAKELLEFEAGQRLMLAEDFVQALGHAKAAYQILPGWGQRLLLAEALLANEQDADVVRLLEDHVDDSPRLLATYAQALEATNQTQACEIWLKYLELRPDLNVEFRIAALEAQTGQSTAAAERAWKIVQSSDVVSLGSDLIHECALLQALGNLPETTVESRVRAIARTLHEKFPNDELAEQHYVRLWLFLDGPRELESPNFQLLTRAGALKKVTIDESKQVLLQQKQQADLVLKLYASGQVPLESVLEVARLDPGRVVLALGNEFLLSGGGLQFETREPPEQGAISELLVSDAELLLLARLEVLEETRTWLDESDVSLVLFADVRQRLCTSEVQLVHERPGQSMENEKAVLRVVEDETLCKVSTDGQNVVWISDGSPNGNVLTRASLIHWLKESGHISESLAARAHHGIRDDVETTDVERWKLGANLDALRWLTTAKLLEPSCEAVGPLVVMESEVAELRDRIRLLERDAQALELYRAVRAWIGKLQSQGRLKIIERPAVSLPEAMPIEDASMARRWLSKALSWRVSCAKVPGRFALLMDGMAHDLFGPTFASKAMRGLAWNQETLRSSINLYWPQSQQLINLGWFMQELDPEYALERTEQLLQWGVAGAFDAEELGRLVGEYRDLGGAAATILDLQERPLRDPNHANHQGTAITLAQVYSSVISEAIKSGDTVADLAIHLLKRWEDADVRGLDTLMHLLVTTIFTHAKEAFVESDDSDIFNLSPKSSIGLLVTAITDWCTGNSNRMPPLGRAVVSGLELLDRASGNSGLTLLQSGPAVLFAGTIQENSTIDMTNYVISSLAILSANSKASPMIRMELESKGDVGDIISFSLEDVLVAGAELIESNRAAVSVREDVAVFRYQLDDHHFMEAQVPIEALVLRCSSLSATAEMARELAARQGAFDGVLYSLWSSLAEQTESPELRRKVARACVDSAWKHARRDLGAIVKWGHSDELQGGGPADLNELKYLLSEPSASTYENEVARVASYIAGAWGGRTDIRALVEESSSLPGMLGWQLVLPELDTDLMDNTRFALGVLDNADRAHFGLLWRSVVSLCVAASRGIVISKNDGDIDLKADLPGLVEGLLEQVVIDSGPGLGEGRVALACRLTVERLRPSGNDVLWLTYRLFNWLQRELRRLDKTEREIQLANIASRNKSASFQNSTGDSLDPLFWKEEGFDLRLASVLNAILIAAELPAGGRLKADLNGELELSSRSCELLCQVVSRPFTELDARHSRNVESRLGWMGPISPTELAMMILLRADSKHFISLPVEVRLRWLHRLPTGEEQPLALSGASAGRLLLAATMTMGELTDVERGIVRIRILSSSASEVKGTPVSATAAAELYRYKVLGEQQTWEIVRPCIANTDIGREVALTYLSAATSRGAKGLRKKVSDVLSLLDEDIAESQLEDWIITSSIFAEHQDLANRIVETLAEENCSEAADK